MIYKCCVPSCKSGYASNSATSSSAKIAMFRFPKTEKLRRKWLRSIHRDIIVTIFYVSVRQILESESKIRVLNLMQQKCDLRLMNYHYEVKIDVPEWMKQNQFQKLICLTLRSHS